MKLAWPALVCETLSAETLASGVKVLMYVICHMKGLPQGLGLSLTSNVLLAQTRLLWVRTRTHPLLFNVVHSAKIKTNDCKVGKRTRHSNLNTLHLSADGQFAFCNQYQSAHTPENLALCVGPFYCGHLSLCWFWRITVFSLQAY